MHCTCETDQNLEDKKAVSKRDNSYTGLHFSTRIRKVESTVHRKINFSEANTTKNCAAD